MKIKKEANSFNTYRAEFNANELRILYTHLQANPGQGPDEEEMLQGFKYFFDRLPAPGEDTSPGKASNSPSPGADAAKDALSPMELEEPPGGPGDAGLGDEDMSADGGSPRTLSQTISTDGTEFVDDTGPTRQNFGDETGTDSYELPEPPEK